MDLTDKRWESLKGGYKTNYDASIPLRRLAETNDPEMQSKILSELWNELHHQGDVGIASYLAVPQLVRIAKSKNLFNWELLGLCVVIEQQRQLGDNPSLPIEFQQDYLKGIESLKFFVIENISRDLDNTTYLIALSALATCTGRIKLGKVLLELENEDFLDELLNRV